MCPQLASQQQMHHHPRHFLRYQAPTLIVVTNKIGTKILLNLNYLPWTAGLINLWRLSHNEKLDALLSHFKKYLVDYDMQSLSDDNQAKPVVKRKSCSSSQRSDNKCRTQEFTKKGISAKGLTKHKGSVVTRTASTAKQASTIPVVVSSRSSHASSSQQHT